MRSAANAATPFPTGSRPVTMLIGVRRRPDRDAAVGLGLLVATHGGTGVEPLGDRTSEVGHAPVADAAETPGELAVHLAAVVPGEQGRLADDQGGPPLADLTAVERSQRVRHLADEGYGQAEVSLAAGGGVLTRQGHLGGDAARDLRRRLQSRSRRPL